MKRLRLVLLSVGLVATLFVPKTAVAQYTSGSYRVEEIQFGAGGDVDSSSASYRGRVNAGNLTGGETSSASYTAFSGFITPNEEFLEVSVSPATLDLGLLNPATTATGTSVFSIRSYLNSTYVVVMMTDPPTSEGGSVLDAMTTPGSSTPGTEQFGINLVANTSPVAMGADPEPLPDGTFAFGEAAPGYDTANTYKFNRTDIIARSITNGWGLTDYTVSYIANISTITPGGVYETTQNIVVTATY